MKTDCVICCATNERILLQTPKLRVIAVDNEANAEAFCRVIWQAHQAEMTDLLPEERQELMDMVYRVESAMRTVLQPKKINLASLGNVVPHLHWHIIARFEQDACFPSPIWANAQRVSQVTLPEHWVEQVQHILLESIS